MDTMTGDRDATTNEHTLDLFRSIKKSELNCTRSHTLSAVGKPEFANRVTVEFLMTNEN